MRLTRTDLKELRSPFAAERRFAERRVVVASAQAGRLPRLRFRIGAGGCVLTPGGELAPHVERFLRARGLRGDRMAMAYELDAVTSFVDGDGSLLAVRTAGGDVEFLRGRALVADAGQGDPLEERLQEHVRRAREDALTDAELRRQLRLLWLRVSSNPPRPSGAIGASAARAWTLRREASRIESDMR